MSFTIWSSLVLITTILHTNEGFTLINKERYARTEDLMKVLKIHTNDKSTNENRMNQGLGVLE